MYRTVTYRNVTTPQIDKNLRFLDSFVASARQAGAKPYGPPEHIVRAYRLSSYLIFDYILKRLFLLRYHLSFNSFTFLTHNLYLLRRSVTYMSIMKKNRPKIPSSSHRTNGPPHSLGMLGVIWGQATGLTPHPHQLALSLLLSYPVL
jgi:hypothetical protein